MFLMARGCHKNSVVQIKRKVPSIIHCPESAQTCTMTMLFAQSNRRDFAILKLLYFQRESTGHLARLPLGKRSIVEPASHALLSAIRRIYIHAQSYCTMTAKVKKAAVPAAKAAPKSPKAPKVRRRVSRNGVV